MKIVLRLRKVREICPSHCTSPGKSQCRNLECPEKRTISPVYQHPDMGNGQPRRAKAIDDRNHSLWELWREKPQNNKRWLHQRPPQGSWWRYQSTIQISFWEPKSRGHITGSPRAAFCFITVIYLFPWSSFDVFGSFVKTPLGSISLNIFLSHVWHVLYTYLSVSLYSWSSPLWCTHEEKDCILKGSLNIQDLCSFTSYITL